MAPQYSKSHDSPLMLWLQIGSHGGYHHSLTRVTVIADDHFGTSKSCKSWGFSSSTSGVPWRMKGGSTYCWASGWSCESKPTLPKKTAIQAFHPFWGKKVSKHVFLLDGQGEVSQVTRAWPSSSRFLNEMVNQKHCQDTSLFSPGKQWRSEQGSGTWQVGFS